MSAKLATLLRVVAGATGRSPAAGASDLPWERRAAARPRRTGRAPRSSERGAIPLHPFTPLPLMVGLVAALAIFAIVSAEAFQVWEDVKRRDDEAEMMSRARQIVRALRRFQQDQGRLPTKLEELLEPGSRGQYFVRPSALVDPLVRDGQWGLLYLAPGGGIYDPGAPGAEGQLEIGGQAGAPPVGGIGGGRAQRAQEVQGLPIAGVKSRATEKPFRVYKGQRDYSLWQFTIFDLETRAGVPGQVPAPPGGQQGGAPGLRRKAGGR